MQLVIDVMELHINEVMVELDYADIEEVEVELDVLMLVIDAELTDEVYDVEQTLLDTEVEVDDIDVLTVVEMVINE